MKGIDKTILLLQLESLVEEHLQTAIGDFQNRKEHELLQPSSTGGWSVAQCLEHLNSYGRFYLPEIEKKIATSIASGNAQMFESTWLGRYVKEMMDPSTSKFSYKAFPAHVPSSKLEPYRVVGEFIEQQERLLCLVRQARKANLDTRVRISVTRFVRLKMGDMFQFLIAHNHRHFLQAKRNLVSSNPLSAF